MSTSNHTLPPKKDVALALLEGPSLFVHLDPRKPEALVPPHFKRQAQLVLQVGLNMAIQIPDLTVEDDGIYCTLSFNRSPFWCKLPWSAIYALVGEDGRGMVWPADVPSEVAAQMERPPSSPSSGAKEPAKEKVAKPKRKLAAAPRLRASDDDVTAVGPADGGEGEGEGEGEATSAAPASTRSPTDELDQQVSAPAAAAAAAPAVEPSVSPALQPSPPSDPPSSPPSSPSGANKKKRELPPYLRVVK